MTYELTLKQVAEVYGIDTTKRAGRVVGVEEDSFGNYKDIPDYILLDFSENGKVSVNKHLVVDICQHNGFSIPSLEKEVEFIKSLPQDMDVEIVYGLIASNVESRTFLQAQIYPNNEENDSEIVLQTDEGPTSKIHLPEESFEVIFKKYLKLFRFLHDEDYSSIITEDVQEIVGNDFEVKEKLKERAKYREDKEWEKADEIRNEFKEYGLKLIDYKKDSKSETSIEAHPKLISYTKILKEAYHSTKEPTLAHFQASLHKTFLEKYIAASDLPVEFEFKYISDEEKNAEDYNHVRDEHKKSHLLIVPEVQLIDPSATDRLKQLYKLFKRKEKEIEKGEVVFNEDLMEDLKRHTDVKPSPQIEMQRHESLFEYETKSEHNDPKFIVIRTKRKHILDENIEWLEN